MISCDILIIIFLIYQYKFLGYKEWRATNNKKGASKIWNIQDAIEPQTGKFRACRSSYMKKRYFGIIFFTV